jgi:hypothetical protein
LNGFEAGVESFGDGIPEVKKGILLEADVDKHGIETRLNVANDPFEDGAYDIFIVDSLHGIFFKRTLLEESDTGFKLFTIDDNFVSFG